MGVISGKPTLGLFVLQGGPVVLLYWWKLIVNIIQIYLSVQLYFSGESSEYGRKLCK